MEDHEGRRFSDDMLIRLQQKFEDHDEWEKAIFKNFEGRIDRLEEFRGRVEKPLNAAGWTILTAIGFSIVTIVGYVWHFLTTHLRLG